MFVLPQINNSQTTVAGYSPAQWVLGYQPAFPGDLLQEQINPAQLGGSPNFESILELRTAAKMALVKADQDMRLRRALLRRYSGLNTPMDPGLVFYWRDARAADLVKIRWLGPARVVMREDEDDDDDDDDGDDDDDDDDGNPGVLACAQHTVAAMCTSSCEA